MMLRRSYILLISLLLSAAGFAQSNCVRQAYEEFQNKEFLKAAELIDECVAGEGANDAQAWHIRGFIYKDIYKEIDGFDVNSTARGEAVTSFAKSMELDESDEFKDANVQSIKYLATMMYNDCVNYLKIDSDDISEELYNLHKETLKLIEPNIDFRAKDIEYYNALASIFDQQYDKDHTQKQYLWRTLEIYQHVLSLDSNDYGANYNTGILYYNEGVEIIKNFDPEMRIDSLIWWQDSTAQLFRLAKPFMLKAYSLNENRLEVPHGLSGIEYSLGNDEASAHWKEVEDKLKNNVELSADETSAFYGELKPIFEEWLTTIVNNHPDVASDKQGEYLDALTKMMNDEVDAMSAKGDILRFRDKFIIKEDLKVKLFEELERLIAG